MANSGMPLDLRHSCGYVGTLFFPTAPREASSLAVVVCAWSCPHTTLFYYRQYSEGKAATTVTQYFQCSLFKVIIVTTRLLDQPANPTVLKIIITMNCMDGRNIFFKIEGIRAGRLLVRIKKSSETPLFCIPTW